MSRIFAVLIVASLAGCGMKGSLEMPPGPRPDPVLGKPKPAQPASPAKDVSTDQKPTPAQ